MSWLDKIAPEPVGLEAIRDVDPEKGVELERAGALKPQQDRSAAIAHLAKQCEEWDAKQTSERPFCKPQHAKIEMPEDLQVPKPRRADNRRVGTKHEKLPWERKAKGEDAYFEAERAAAGRDAKPKSSLLTRQTPEEAATEVRTLKNEVEPEPVAPEAELEAERDMTAGLEVRKQQLAEAIDVGNRLEQAPPVTTFVADTVAQQQTAAVLKRCGDAVRAQKPDFDRACEFFEQHFERDMLAKGFDKATRDALRPQIAAQYIQAGVAQGVNPAALIYASACNFGYRPPMNLTSLAKVDDAEFKSKLKEAEALLKELQVKRPRAA